MSTRKLLNRKWDLDVGLRLGIPNTFPLFHGWVESRKKIVFYSKNFHNCIDCGEWVSEIDIDTHNCFKHFQENIIDEEIYESDSESITTDPPEIEEEVYVIANDDNYENMRCDLCKELMKLKYIHDLEEWVFMDCLDYEQKVIHKICHDVVYK